MAAVPRLIVLAAIAVAASLSLYAAFRTPPEAEISFEALQGDELCTGEPGSFADAALPQNPAVSIILPDLGLDAQRGRAAFAQHCASCHGTDAAGNAATGPTLIHPFYAPSRHPDGAIIRAVQNGARGHHWEFGNMPPVSGLGSAELFNIIAFIRDVQRANGIN